MFLFVPLLVSLFNSIIYTITAKISDREIGDVAYKLSPNNLQDLYNRLNLPREMVEHAEFGHTDSKLSGRAVLIEWRKQRPGEATKGTVLKALGNCYNLEAARALFEEWTSDS